MPRKLKTLKPLKRETSMKRKGEDRILTVPNIISFIRILLIPVFAVLLFKHQDIYAFLIFILACISDGIDGLISRWFNQKTKLGVILDPIADRGLLLVGTIMLCYLDRLPLWILILVLLRDVTFLCGGLYLMKSVNWKPKVIWLGKIATTFFYIGFAMLILGGLFFGIGLGIINVSWLPGFSNDYYFLGIWPVYIGIFLNIFTSTYYVKAAIVKYKEVKNGQK